MRVPERSSLSSEIHRQPAQRVKVSEVQSDQGSIDFSLLDPIPQLESDQGVPSVETMAMSERAYDQDYLLLPAFESTESQRQHFRSVFKEKLSARERQVLGLRLHGKSEKQVALELTLSVKTVKSHIKNVFDKLEIRNLLEIVHYVHDCNLFGQEDRTEVVQLTSPSVKYQGQIEPQDEPKQKEAMIAPSESAFLQTLRNLTHREREIAVLVAQELTNRQIAQELFVEVKTVKTHIRSIFKKLKVADRVMLRDCAKKFGLPG